MAWLLAGVWQLKGQEETDTGSCPLCVGEEDVKHITGVLAN
jgi:hypothetical protein